LVVSDPGSGAGLGGPAPGAAQGDDRVAVRDGGGRWPGAPQHECHRAGPHRATWPSVLTENPD
jgi:hypothetical protein